ncbi:hypothetical protein KJS94_00570 [Flavihumibacter rivuli]|uniref:hypothetical protein n=1 Tax=Flavihumibacter rivuli TaxID=2838156 RepID=UPI001BDE8F89|nr:hypothetical protein [Flavihumibacter rivuli]ULQ56687.1 hypothetical protein KJS94_00570 [Flavihumibacter rivuli]
MKWGVGLLGLLIFQMAIAQKRWTGLSGNNSWADPGNWESGLVPVPGEQVILDNAYVPVGFVVVLPNTAVSIASLTIAPSQGNVIELVLPASNTISSATGSLEPRGFSVTGSGYSLVLENGAVFRNASGSASGYSIRIGDSIRINDGGRYIHQSRTGHAELVSRLSRLPGTEMGVFTMANTDAASTISLSGRVFGSLELIAGGATGITSYSSTGTNQALVRGNFILGEGVSFSLHFSDTLFVGGNMELSGPVLNLASGNRSSVISLKGNLLQYKGSLNETNQLGQTGTIFLSGVKPQLLDCRGEWKDSVILKVRNMAGVRLVSPLSLPYQLHLERGVVTTSQGAILALEANAKVLVDSASDQSYIEGPLQKKGLNKDAFLFPVGKDGKQRWLMVKEAMGDFSVTYWRKDPDGLGGSIGPGLDHISSNEYWEIKGSAGADAVVALSFDHEWSGGVNELASLRVAGLQSGIWSDLGNIAVTGAALASGSVTSQWRTTIPIPSGYYTLASSTLFANPLPVVFHGYSWQKRSGRWWLRVELEAEMGDMVFLEEMFQSVVRGSLDSMVASGGKRIYEFLLPEGLGNIRLRVGIRQENGNNVYGPIIPVPMEYQRYGKAWLVDEPSGKQLVIAGRYRELVQVCVYDSYGRLLAKQQMSLGEGVTRFPLPAAGRTGSLKFIIVLWGSGDRLWLQYF